MALGLLIARDLGRVRAESKMAGVGQSVELCQLPVAHLEALRSQLEEEVKVLSNSMSQLKGAQQKFLESNENVKKLSKREQGKQLLVPLTGSMYIPGKLENINSVLVDIGTGYFVEKSVEEAEGYFDRKVVFITKQLEKLQPTIIEKHKLRQAVLEMLNQKVQAQQGTMVSKS